MKNIITIMLVFLFSNSIFSALEDPGSSGRITRYIVRDMNTGDTSEGILIDGRTFLSNKLLVKGGLICGVNIVVESQNIFDELAESNDEEAESIQTSVTLEIKKIVKEYETSGNCEQFTNSFQKLTESEEEEAKELSFPEDYVPCGADGYWCQK